MTEYEYKLNNFLYPLISEINKINILEFGVQKGRSTLKFLEICSNNDGHLFSADIDDCSDVSKDPRWTFIKSRDDNFDLIKSKIPKKVDVIFLDSLHEAAHVENIIYKYFDLLNKDGFFFIDDICFFAIYNDSDFISFSKDSLVSFFLLGFFSSAYAKACCIGLFPVAFFTP